jgi:hypothetical protein
VNGKFDGEGKKYFVEGDVYEGNFSNGMAHG